MAKKCVGTIAYLGGLPAVLERFCWSWGQMIQFNSEYLCNPTQAEYVHYDRATVSLHFFARNSLVERYLGDYLLMLDTDHEFEPDIAVRLVTNLTAMPQADVLVGVYCHRASPQGPVLYQWNPERTAVQPIGAWGARGKQQQLAAFEIGSAGAGCLLVRRHVFERMRKAFKGGPFDMRQGLGEDHSFFWRLGELGMKAYACPLIEVPHLEVRGLRLKDFHVEPGDIRVRTPVEGLVRLAEGV